MIKKKKLIHDTVKEKCNEKSSRFFTYSKTQFGLTKKNKIKGKNFGYNCNYSTKIFIVFKQKQIPFFET